MSILARFFVENMHTIVMVSMIIVCSLSLLVAIEESVKAYRLHRENERLKNLMNHMRVLIGGDRLAEEFEKYEVEVASVFDILIDTPTGKR